MSHAIKRILVTYTHTHTHPPHIHSIDFCYFSSFKVIFILRMLPKYIVLLKLNIFRKSQETCNFRMERRIVIAELSGFRNAPLEESFNMFKILCSMRAGIKYCLVCTVIVCSKISCIFSALLGICLGWIYICKLFTQYHLNSENRLNHILLEH